MSQETAHGRIMSSTASQSQAVKKVIGTTTHLFRFPYKYYEILIDGLGKLEEQSRENS